MTLVVFGAVRSSPGVTTSSLAIASCIPQAVLVEADPDGGVLAARYGLAREPNLASYAAATRADPTASSLRNHAQALPGGLGVVVGMPSPDHTVALLRSAGKQLATCLANARDAIVVVDAGRLTPSGPNHPMLEAADLTVLLARPRPEELYPLALRVDALRSATRDLVLALVGNRPYGRAEVAAQVGLDVVGELASDPRAAAVLAGVSHARGAGWIRRSALARSARSVAAAIIDRAGSTSPRVAAAEGRVP